MDILITEDVSSPGFDALAEEFEVVVDATLWSDDARLTEAIREARAIVVRNQTQVTAELLAGAPQLSVVGRCGVGLDNIDVDEATRLGIVVVAPLGANAVSVAEFTMGLLISVARKISFGDRSTRAGGWDRKGCAGVELEGKTVAICGFGRIGRNVATRARAFGMNIAVYDPYMKPDSPELKAVDGRLMGKVEDALAVADFICLHSALTEETRHLIDRRTLEATKPGAYLINTSRGGIVDERALIDSLKTGRLAGAALDVREVEPPEGRAELEAMENVVLTPHCASFTREAQARTLEAVAGDLGRILRGEAAVNFVNMAEPKRGAGE